MGFVSVGKVLLARKHTDRLELTRLTRDSEHICLTATRAIDNVTAKRDSDDTILPVQVENFNIAILFGPFPHVGCQGNSSMPVHRASTFSSLLRKLLLLY